MGEQDPSAHLILAATASTSRYYEAHLLMQRADHHVCSRIPDYTDRLGLQPTCRYGNEEDRRSEIPRNSETVNKLGWKRPRPAAIGI